MHRNSFYNKVEEAIISALFQQVSDYFYSRGAKRPVFIEVGANDGVTSSKTIDFIRHQEWGGLLVEPVPAVFSELQKNISAYGGVKAVNAAISNHFGTLPFYQVIGKSERAGDAWLPMLSSFDRNIILKQALLFPDIAEHITQIDVRSLTIEDLCDEYKVDKLDILITDAEGYDDIIVKTVDFRRRRPMIVQIEHIHIAPARLRDLDSMLMAQGYQRCIMWMDTIWFAGDILTDECVQRMIRTMPTFMPDYDTTFGNGYWFNHFG